MLTITRSSPAPLDFIDDAKEFYDYLLYRKLVRFVPHPRSVTTKDDVLDVEMSSKYTYDQMAAKVAERLNVDPTHLRFHTVNSSTGNPKTPVKRAVASTLQNILFPPYSSFGNSNQRGDTLYYEVLDMSLSELDTKKSIKVTWLSEGVTKEVSRECALALAPTKYFRNNSMCSWPRMAMLQISSTHLLRKHTLKKKRAADPSAFTRHIIIGSTRNSRLLIMSSVLQTTLTW